jgi:hypothetical protein
MAKKFRPSGQSAYEAFLEDQRKREEEAKKGQVRYVEAAKASRVQYSNQYQGKSQNQGKTYNWERDLMQNEKIKGAGNSYTKKFDALTKRMGMTPGQADEFRKFMDFQEDSQHVDPKMNKDKSINESQSLKYARDSKLKVDVVDGILDNMVKTSDAKIKKAKETKAKFTKDTQKAAENVTKERSGFLGFLDSTLGRIGENATKVFGEQFARDNNEVMQQNNLAELKADPTDKQALAQLQMQNTTGREAQGGLEKTSDFVGRALGEIAPYTIGGAYGAADTILGKLGANAIKKPLVKDLVRGLTAGGVVGTGKAVTRDTLAENPEDFDATDYLKTIGLEAGLAGAGDAAIGAFARNINLKGQAQGLSDDIANNYAKALGGGKTPDQIALALRESVTPKNVLADPVKQDPQHVLEQLTDGWSKQPPLKVNNWQDNAYKKPPVDEQPIKDDYLLDAHTRRQAAEDDFIQQELAPHMESQGQAAQAQASWENVVKHAKTEIERIKGTYGKIHVPKGALEDLPIPRQFKAANADKLSDDIYKFADQEGFKSPEEAVRYLQQLDVDAKTKLKELMPQDHKPFTEDDWTNLESLARQKFPQTEQGKAMDRLITDLIEGNTTSTPLRTIENAPTPGLPQNVDEILKNVKKSQSPEQVLESLVRPKGETEAISPAPASGEGKAGSDLLMRLDSQVFNDATTNNSLVSTEKPIQSVSAIDSIKNPVKRRLNKFYESAVNSTHSAKVAHTQVLENAIKKAEATGVQPKKVAALKEQLKSVKKNGSDLEKSIQNQAAAGNKAKTFLDGHMDELQKALGSTKPEDMAEAIRYQVAKNIRWIWDNVNPDYVVGGGWDRGRINTIVNSGIGNTKLEAFTTAMKNLTQERLDLSLKHGLINKQAHAALSKNPFYIPMARDVTPGMDNVGRSLKEGTTKNKGKAGAYFIQSLGDGDAEALYKDPLESLMTGTFSMFKNIAKEDTHKQLYNMAKLDSDKLFTRMVSKKQFDTKGGIAVPTPKGTKYIQIQDDLQKMIQENDLPYDLNVLGKVTSAFAGLKTRSLEYHMTGVPRDLAEGYLKGQINNPVKYLSELVKAAKEHNLSAKQAGAYFDRAYKDGMNGINQEKMMKEYARQNGNVKPFNPKSKESWKELTSTILRIADMPFKPIKALGQLSDELPRTVEVKATERAFTKQHGAKIENIKRALDQVNSKIEASSQATDPFDPALQGIDKLKGQKEKLENMLNEYDKSLEREQTFRGRDIMNFSRAGRGGVAKHIRQYAIFANTTTQSKDKLVRSFIERPGATIGKVALLTAPLVYAEHVMHQNLTEGDKKIYDNLPTWAKQYNYVYVNNGSVYTVPKIQELALLTNPIEAILSGSKEDLNASARLAVKEAVPYQVGNFAQGLVPNADGSVTIRKNAQVPSTVASPALDVAANDKLGFNRNAISFADKFGRQDAKANKFTLDLFKKTFGNKARADYAQYLATQYPGDAGKYGTHILDWLMEPGNNDKLDAMIQNLNPLQDRIYSKDGEVLGHKVVKNPPKKPAVKK